MKINHLGLGQTPPSRSLVDDATGGSGTDQGASAPAPGYTPSPELLQLIERARGEPEVRDDRVQAAASRLREGHYHTPASALATATALLHSLD